MRRTSTVCHNQTLHDINTDHHQSQDGFHAAPSSRSLAVLGLGLAMAAAPVIGRSMAAASPVVVEVVSSPVASMPQIE